MSEEQEHIQPTEIPSARGKDVIHGSGGVWVRLANELAGRYGFVLALILLDYVALSLLSGETAPWARVVAQISLGLTLIVTLVAAQAPRRWIIVAAVFVFAGLLALGGAALLQGDIL